MQHHPIVQECFNGIVRLREGHSDAHGARDVHALLSGAVQRMLHGQALAGLTPADAADVAFAVVALADEVAMRCGEAVAELWQTQKLQTVFFGEHDAGELFFERLRGIEHRGQPKAAVLFAYDTALALGFEGRHCDASGRDELAALSARLRRAIGGPAAASPQGLSPHALAARAPSAQPPNRLTRATAYLLATALACVVLIVALQTLMRARLQGWTADVQARHTILSPTSDTQKFDDEGAL